jgi:L-aminopeptidase/D-esterase-like protein
MELLEKSSQKIRCSIDRDARPMIDPASTARARPRARDLGIPFEGTPGRWNAITDVPGVEVGYTTLLHDLDRAPGETPGGGKAVRTGVTAIFPRGKASGDPVFGGWFSLNGNGEMTGAAWLEESGSLEGPIVITNTHSVGVARDAVIAWLLKQGGSRSQEWSLPVVAETYDGWLNDINGFHVRPEHVFAALDGAAMGPITEGNVGGGTGMVCYEFKGGSGTSSRVTGGPPGGFAVGVLVQANHGLRRQLQVGGVPVGREITEEASFSKGGNPADEKGSIIVVVATDAPLLPHQLRRLARRPALGLARTGSVSGNGSGDIFIAFSTANPRALRSKAVAQVAMLSNDSLDALFAATVEATEEAIINALVAAETMVGTEGHRAVSLPHERLKQILARHHH